jgi:predicted DCC family thiol-disulfide oxidoreductase YuxK
MSHPILLYDGVCGLCNRLVQFVLARDRNATFRFASLQSPLAAKILSRHNINPTNLDTVYVVVNPAMTGSDPTNSDPSKDVASQGDHIESLRSRSDAVLYVLHQLGGFWCSVATLIQPLPKSLRDAAYSAVARHRYRIFGRFGVCSVPRNQDRGRFLDL